MGKRKGLAFFKKLLSSRISLLILALIALAFFIIGLFIHNNFLQGVGGVLGASALTLFITFITSREAVLQQSAKEANIERKNGYYIPMFNELKQLYDIIEDAKQKRLPYPQFIKGITNNPPSSFIRGKYPLPTFENWKIFKEPPYRGNFTEKVCKLFDKVEEIGLLYNRDVSEAREPVIGLLNPEIDAAFREWANGNDYKHWAEESKNGTAWTSSQYNQWNGYILRYFQRPTPSQPEAQDPIWVYNLLGWILANDIGKASSAMRDIYQNDFQNHPTPDISWFKDILEGVWAQLQDLSSVRKVSITSEELLTKTGNAKDYMLDRLNYIRDMYEGGEPPL